MQTSTFSVDSGPQYAFSLLFFLGPEISSFISHDLENPNIPQANTGCNNLNVWHGVRSLLPLVHPDSCQRVPFSVRLWSWCIHTNYTWPTLWGNENLGWGGTPLALLLFYKFFSNRPNVTTVLCNTSAACLWPSSMTLSVMFSFCTNRSLI